MKSCIIPNVPGKMKNGTQQYGGWENDFPTFNWVIFEVNHVSLQGFFQLKQPGAFSLLYVSPSTASSWNHNTKSVPLHLELESNNPPPLKNAMSCTCSCISLGNAAATACAPCMPIPLPANTSCSNLGWASSSSMIFQQKQIWFSGRKSKNLQYKKAPCFYPAFVLHRC